MVTLKEKEAVEYLKRARSCLHPEEDNFSNIPLLASMLDIEIAFLQHTQSIGLNELSRISIDATGLPELGSWLGDIQSSIKSFKGVIALRARAWGNVLQQLINGSPVGISSHGKELAKSLKKDSYLTRILQEMTEEEANYLKKPPISLHKTIPGLLSMTEQDYSINVYNQNRYLISGIPPRAGIKYVDSLSYERAPFMSYVFLPANKIKLMTPNLSLTSLSQKRETDEIVEYRRLGPIEVPIFRQTIDISRDKVRNKKKESYYKDFYTIQNVGKNLQDLHPAVLRAFFAFEGASFSDESKEAFLRATQKLDQMIKRTLEYSPKVLGGKRISESEDFSDSLSSETESIFASLPDDYCRGLFQVALGDALEGEIKRSGKLSQLALPAPGHLPALPPRGSLTKRLWGSFKREIEFNYDYYD